MSATPWWLNDPVWSKQHGLERTYPLTAHLLDSAASASILWDQWVRPGLRQFLTEGLGFDDQQQCRAALMLAAGLHDIGKASPSFATQAHAHLSESDQKSFEAIRQELERAGLPTQIGTTDSGCMRRHEQVSALHLQPSLAEGVDPSNGPKITTSWVAMTAAAHHGSITIPDQLAREVFTDLAGGAWAQHRVRVQGVVEDAVGMTLADLTDARDGAAAFIACGLVILADRTASEQVSVAHGQQLQDGFTGDAADWVAHRAEFFAERIHDTLGLPTGPADVLQAVLGEHQDTPRHLQAEVIQHGIGPGLWQVMAPTGTGKTEAALLRHFEGEHPERMIFALPTQATTNKMMERISQKLEGTGMVASLGHSMAIIEDFYATDSDFEGTSGDGGLYPTEFTATGTNRLLAPVSVCTIDQPLKTALGMRFSPLLLAALVNSHLVIDEVHLLDPYQARLAEVVLAWMGKTGARVSLLSATLDSGLRARLEHAYRHGTRFKGTADELVVPAFPCHRRDGGVDETIGADRYQIDVATSEVTAHRNAEAIHVQWALERIRTDPGPARLGIIVNRVKRAEQIAEQLAEHGVEVVLLHSRMMQVHKSQAHARLYELAGKDAPAVGDAGFVMVATQVAESSLDIDLDALSTDLAPAAALIQRAGRVWRHQKPGRQLRVADPNLPIHIVRDGSKGANWPYFAGELERTWAWIKPRTQISLPEDVQDWIEVSAFRDTDAKAWSAPGADTTEIGAIMRRMAEGAGAAERMWAALGTSRPSARWSRLIQATTAQDGQTRLTERPSVTVVICDPDGTSGIPGAWRGTPEKLRRLSPRQRSELREVLGASLSTMDRRHVGAIQQIRADMEARSGWEPRTGMLTRMTPVTADQAKRVFGW